MKKLLILTNVLWLSLFAFMAFRPAEQPNPKKAGETSVALGTAPNLTPILTPNNCNAICSDYSKVEFNGLISGYSAKGLTGNYKRNHLQQVNHFISPDAQSVWFSLETLKAFLWKIESTTCNKGCNVLNLGVRIYFAEYPEVFLPNASDMAGVDPAYAKHHTLLMVPTYAKSVPNGHTIKYINYDFDPNYITFGGKGNCTAPITLTQLFNDTKNTGTGKDIFGNASNGLFLMPQASQLYKTSNATTNVASYSFQNHGCLCPPACTGEDYFAN